MVDVATATTILTVAEVDAAVFAHVASALARAGIVADRMIGTTSERDGHYFLTIGVANLPREARDTLLVRLDGIDGVHDVRILDKPMPSASRA